MLLLRDELQYAATNLRCHIPLTLLTKAIAATRALQSLVLYGGWQAACRLDSYKILQRRILLSATCMSGGAAASMK
jgi:hypothetical protein